MWPKPIRLWRCLSRGCDLRSSRIGWVPHDLCLLNQRLNQCSLPHNRLGEAHGKQRDAMDWLDPNTWKQPAALLEDWRSILVGVIGIGAAVAGAFRRSRQWVASLLSKTKARDSKSAAVERPLRFVQVENQSFWGPMTRGREQGTQVAGHWHVTNTSEGPLLLLKARIDGHHAEHTVIVTEGASGGYSSRTVIAGRSIRRVGVNLSFFPAIISGFEPLVADVIFTDNFEDEHRVRSVSFKPIHRRPSQP